MEIKYGEGLEFECDDEQQEGPASVVDKTVTHSLPVSDKEEALRQIMRHGFRAPVASDQGMTLTIDQESYVVFNLSVQGVGIYLNQLGKFEEQTRLQGMSLSLAEQTFAVDGTIMHLSNDGAHYLCGIELNGMGPECQAAILAYLQRTRSVLFAS